jgi:hypothetical protein
MSDTASVAYTLSLDDHLALDKHLRSGLNFWQRQEFVFMLGVVLFFAYGVVKGSAKSAGMDIPIMVGIAAVTAGLVYGYVVYLKRDAVRRNFKALQEQLKNQRSTGQISLTISPEALFIHTDTSDERHGWRLIQKVSQDNDHGYLFLNKDLAYIVPGRAFADKVQFEHFMTTARLYFEASR